MRYLIYAVAALFVFYTIRYFYRLTPGIIRRIRLAADDRLYQKAMTARQKKALLAQQAASREAQTAEKQLSEF